MVLGHRQLRFVHLQPGSIPGRDARGNAGAPQRSNFHRANPRGQAGTNSDFAGTLFAARVRLSNEIIRTFSLRFRLWAFVLGTSALGHVLAANVVVNYRMITADSQMHGRFISTNLTRAANRVPAKSEFVPAWPRGFARWKFDRCGAPAFPRASRPGY